MSESPAPGTLQTGAKAWTASAAALLIWLLQRFALGEEPDMGSLLDILRELALAAGLPALAGFLTYLVPNRPRSA